MSTASLSRPTLLDWGDTWSRERIASGLYRTSEMERLRLLDALRRAPFGALPIDEITPDAIRRWVIEESMRPIRRGCRVDGQWVSKAVPGTRVRRATVESMLGLIRVCIRDAVDSGIATRNPAARVGLPREPRIDDPWAWLTLDEIALVTSAPVPLDLRLLVTVAVYTGMRKGELWGLRMDDVRLEGARPEVTVRRSYNGPTKSGKPRTVPLLLPAREAIAALFEITATRPNPLGLVAPYPNGKMRSAFTSAAWNRWRARVGITRRVRWHDLRHTCASHLVQGSWGHAWSLHRVAKMLGHASVATTERYAHLSPDALAADAQATDLFFADSKKDGLGT